MGKASRIKRVARIAAAGVRVTYPNGEVDLHAFASLADAEKLSSTLLAAVQSDADMAGVVVELVDAQAVRELVHLHGR
jgi:hypothetical protein